MEPDSALFGTVMLAAGKAGQLELAFELQEDMRAEGIKPCQVCSQHLPPTCQPTFGDEC